MGPFSVARFIKMESVAYHGGRQTNTGSKPEYQGVATYPTLMKCVTLYGPPVWIVARRYEGDGSFSGRCMGRFSATCFVRMESGAYHGAQHPANTCQNPADSGTWRGNTPRAPKQSRPPEEWEDNTKRGEKKRTGETRYILLMRAVVLK